VKFSGGTMSFTHAEFSAGAVDFTAATSSGGTVDIGQPRGWTVSPVGMDGSEPGVTWPPAAHLVKISAKTS
jgi:hypothetical protein